MQSQMPAGMEIFMLLFTLLPMGLMVLGYIFLLIAFWRGMKAHESIAESLRQMAQSGTRPSQL